jgi:hypothetical protein
MTDLRAVFADPRTMGLSNFGQMSAAADFLGNGAIEINRYEPEIFDIVARSSLFLNRIDNKPATGHPHRYFEETAIGTATFADPRNIAPTPTGPTRIENAAFIKALTAQTNLSLFDVDVTRQQGQFAYLEAKDIQDAVNAIVRLQAANVWNGNDTSLSAPTTQQYMGILTQISAQSTIGLGASIIDGLKSVVAAMVARTDFDVMPTGIFINPVLGDLIDREAKAQHIDLGEVDVGAGVKVSGLNTQAGRLPLISEKWIPSASAAQYGFAAPPSGKNNYFAAIVTEKAIEMPFIHGGDGNPKPRIFQLGLLAGLQGQYVAAKFDTIIAKGPSYAHMVVAVTR